MPQTNEFRHGLDQLNDVAKEELEKQSDEVRKQLLGFAKGVFKQVLKRDIANRSEAADGHTVQYWGLIDEQAAPTENDQLQSTVSFMVEGHPVPGGNPQRLRFHMPLPAEFDIDSEESIELLPVPKAIFSERIELTPDGQQVLGRYAITASKAYSYQNAMDTQTEQHIEGDDLGSPEMWASLERRVDTRLPILTSLYEDLVNWNLIPQRQSIVGEPGHTDL